MSFTDEHEDVHKKGHLHGIEVFNDYSLFPIVSDWCNEYDLGIVAVSDVHTSEFHTYGLQNVRRPITLILAESRTETSIRDAFFAHRTIGWVADMIFGRQEWVEKLFASCVEASVAHGNVTLRNKGDIPMHLRFSGDIHELESQSEITFRFAAADRLQVMNWYVGTDKPLEISFDRWV